MNTEKQMDGAHDTATRPYRKRRRARQEEETRRRITEAVVELHRTVGPANTKVTEVAERAGVSRMTVYNHFPGESDLIEACSTHWAERNPFPDPASWAEIEDPHDRLATALGELYAWYRSTEDMMGNVLRDAPLVAPLGEIMEQRWSPYLERVVTTLAAEWMTRSEGGDVRAAVRMVVDFHTWRLLAGRGTTGSEHPGEGGAGDRHAAALAARMVAGLSGTQ